MLFGIVLKKSEGKENRMLKKLVRSLVKKHGMKGLLIKIGDWAVKSSPNKDDDAAWEEVVKPFIEDNF